MLLKVIMRIIFQDKKMMDGAERMSNMAVNEWFSHLNKREMLIMLSINKMGHADDFAEIKNVELVLMSGVEPKRRYVENGAPCIDYPSFDEITDKELIQMWKILPEDDKLQLFMSRGQ